MARYVKKPVVVDAVLWRGFTGDIYPLFDSVRDYEENKGAFLFLTDGTINIYTLEGTMMGKPNEVYIIRGVNGEFYPCKKDIFEKTYEKVDD